MVGGGVRGGRNAAVVVAAAAVGGRALGCGGFFLVKMSPELVRVPSALPTTAIPPATSIGAHS